MSLTYGFYNSIDGDRKYDAVQISSIFDGLIIDGVFASIGTAFSVKASVGLTVNVGEGKAWFNHTWTVNDAELPLLAPESEMLLDRIDAVVLEVDSSEAVRANDIKFVKGTPASYPERPVMTNDVFVHQYPLCYIYRKAASTEIRQADITPMIGSEETPFVAAILKTLSLEELLGKWQDELDQFVLARQREFDIWFNTKKEELTSEHEALRQWIANEESGYTAWLTEMKAKITSDLQAELDAFNEWEATRQGEFMAWFDSMKGQLSTDAAGNLQLQQDKLKEDVNTLINKEEIKQILVVGFVDGDKEISEDGSMITFTAKDGRKLVKTFNETFSELTTVLSSAEGVEIARTVKTFSTDGLLINTTVTYA